MKSQFKETAPLMSKLLDRENNQDRTSINMDKVEIVALPRRSDDLYMRGVRRPRA